MIGLESGWNIGGFQAGEMAFKRPRFVLEFVSVEEAEEHMYVILAFVGVYDVFMLQCPPKTPDPE